MPLCVSANSMCQMRLESLGCSLLLYDTKMRPNEINRKKVFLFTIASQSETQARGTNELFYF